MNTEERIKEILTEEGIKFHPKTGIEKLLVKLAEVDTDEAKEILAANEVIEEAKKKAGADETPAKEVKAKKSPKVAKPKVAKLITVEEIYGDFEKLQAKLDSFEKQQHKIKKPWRNAFTTKMRVDRDMKLFKRNS